MGPCLTLLVRATTALAVLAASLAIAVARLVPSPVLHREAAPARYAAINGHFLEPVQPATGVLDTELGRVSPLPLPDGDRLEWASFSDWAEKDGRRQVVGRWFETGPRRDGAVFLGAGLGRFEFPSGRALDRIVMSDAVPSAPPCWYPGRAARVVYPAADGQLYHFAFESADGKHAPSGEGVATRITWDGVPAARGGVWVHDMSWPKAPQFGGKLLASVSPVPAFSDAKVLPPARLWWLQLSEDGTSVVAAEPLPRPRPSADGSDQFEERFPQACRLADGTVALAYHVRPPGERVSVLRVSRVEFGPARGAGALRLVDDVRLAGDCKAVPPVFTAKGDGPFLLHWGNTGRAGIRRHSLSDAF
jgi:hypothetical protein